MKPIKDYENYCIDIDGNIFNIITNKYLQGSIGEHGYRYYRLTKNGKKKNPLSVANGLIGFVFGLFKGALVVFVLISITTYLIGVPSLADNNFINTASDSSLYQLLLDYNPFNVITEGILWVNSKKM